MTEKLIPIMQRAKKDEERILRKPPPEVDVTKLNTKEMRGLIRSMRETMRKADGIGLAANQVNVPMRMFVAEVDRKFYAVFNPQIVKASAETSVMEEGCLSVPFTFGNVTRADTVTLAGYDLRGKKLKIRAWGLLAKVFQHECDHLDGKLFIDRATDVHEHQPGNDK